MAMLATQVLSDEYVESESKKEDGSDLVGFIVVENIQYEIRKGENKIGRDPEVCSIVLNSNTVSKLHAVIESEGRDDTFIYDVGSTNAVRLGKKSLKPHYRYKLDDGSVITFGNIVAKFILPPETSDACSGSILQTPVSQGEDNLKLEDLDLGDIFDVATQVNVPQPSTSKSGNSEDNFQIFKIPNSLSSVRQQVKNSLEISENGVGCVNENKVKPDGADKPLVFRLSPIEDSNIFSLETQAQIDTSPNTVENATETVLNRNDEKLIIPDRVNSLLNDGQDDILCTFMSMHSPKRKDESTSHEVIIKTEPVEELEEVFEVQTQVAPQSVPKNSVIEKEIALLTEDLQKDTNFVKEFFEQDENDSCQNQSQTEKHTGDVNSKNIAFKNNELILETKEKSEKGENSKETNSQENCSKGFTQVRSQEEDFVQTQEFFMENFFKPTEIKSKVDNPLSKDRSENSDTESCLEVELEGSPKFDKKKTDSSDFTYPVKFMEYEEVKKNSSHLFQDVFQSTSYGKSIKKELDIDNDKNVECSHEGNSDKDDTESFLEISIEDLPDKEKTPEKVNKQSTDKEETKKEGNSSFGEKSKALFPEQTIFSKTNNETFNEDNEDDFEDFIETQQFCNPVKVITPNGDNDETQIFEPPTFQNLNALTKDTINVDPGRSSPDMLSDNDFITTQPFNEENVKRSKPCDSVLSESQRKDVNSKTGQIVSAVESSDDETEPYLKLEEDHDEGLHTKGKNILKLNESKDSNELDHHNQSRSLLLEENENSNSSYVFQLEEEDQRRETDFITGGDVKLERKKESWKENKGSVCMDSDSDATDCEEIDMIQGNMMPIKEEIIEKDTQGETQVLTLTLPDNFAEKQYNEKEDGWMRGNESPKFEMIRESDNESNQSWSQLSLKMPSTQDVEMTLKKILKNESEKVSGQNEEEKSTKASTYKQIPLEIKKTELQKSTEKTEPQTSTLIQTLARGKNLPNMGEGDRKRLFDSPVKRNRDKDNTVDVVPIKKSRTSINPKNDTPSTSGAQPVTSTQKLLSKLWQTHDIAQIQPTRTRSSSKNMETEGNQNKNKVTDINETPNRRRSSRLGSANKRQKTDMNPNIHKKVEEAKKSFQSERRRNSNKQNERFSKEKNSEVGGMRVLRNTRRNSCDLVRLNNSFDGTSSFEINVSNNSSRRLSKTINNKSCSVQVLFTGFDCEPLEKVVSDLGGKRTNDLSSGTVVVADKVRRTVKFLCGIGLGLPIVSPQWLWLSKKENKFLNPWNHLLKEEESEEKWDFDLRKSLEKSKKKKLLEGYSVFATENAKPPVKDLLTIVECCGGIPLIHHPEKWPKKTIVASCLEDKNSWPSSKLRNVKIVHYEFILSGVLRQKIDFKTYKLR